MQKHPSPHLSEYCKPDIPHLSEYCVPDVNA